MKNWKDSLIKDCKDCINCDSIRGFMCNCRYSYDDNAGHYQIGQCVNRKTAERCEHYADKPYDRDEVLNRFCI